MRCSCDDAGHSCKIGIKVDSPFVQYSVLFILSDKADVTNEAEWQICLMWNRFDGSNYDNGNEDENRSILWEWWWYW